MKIYFHTDEEIRALVKAFESCSFHPSEFRHCQHLAVALWYVRHLPYEEALDQMTNGIRRLAQTYGKSGYHETITLFWLRVVTDFAHQARDKSLATLANQMIDKYHDKKLIFEYYSAELLDSAEAKRKWMEPDLKTLEFPSRKNEPAEN